MMSFTCALSRRNRASETGLSYILRPVSYQIIDIHGENIDDIDMSFVYVTIYGHDGSMYCLRAQDWATADAEARLSRGNKAGFSQIVFGKSNSLYINVFLGKASENDWEADLSLALTNDNLYVSITIPDAFDQPDPRPLNNWLHGARFSEDCEFYTERLPDLSIVRRAP